jgi:hypothetical protein
VVEEVVEEVELLGVVVVVELGVVVVLEGDELLIMRRAAPTPIRSMITIPCYNKEFVVHSLSLHSSRCGF